MMATLWNTELLQRWVDALRSGQYPMGYGRLAPRDENGNYSYCCLGVACEVAGLDKWIDEDGDQFAKGSVVYSAGVGSMYSSNCVLPGGFKLPFGGGSKGYLCLNNDPGEGFVSWGTVHSQVDGTNVTLTDCNDSKQFTQNQLADVIEFFFLNPARAADAVGSELTSSHVL
jgi:hypothetical protein